MPDECMTEAKLELLMAAQSATIASRSGTAAELL
jgi:hypothetical protein